MSIPPALLPDSLRRLVAFLIVAGSLFSAGAASAAAPVPSISPADAHVYRKAFDALERGQLERALAIGREGGNRLAWKVLYWYYLYNTGSGASFEEIADFITRNPDWPYLWRLRRHAEDVLPDSLSDARIIAYFDANPPQTLDARLRYAEALQHSGHTARATDWIRRAWIGADFDGRSGARDEKRFLAKHEADLRPEDHMARARRLLWNIDVTQAFRLLRYLKPADRAVVRAWGRLMRHRTDRDEARQALAAVPASRRDEPGLIWAEAQYDSRHGDDEAARRVLIDAPPISGEPGERIWIERNDQARQAIEDQDYATAYRLATGHGLKSGFYFAEATFLAGWLALRHLHRPKDALRHFTTLYAGVSYPVSRARAAYWAGRAEETLHHEDKAKAWYGKAAAHPATFYGQLAAMRLGSRIEPGQPRPVTATERGAFYRKELVRAVLLMGRIGAERFREPFLLKLFDDARTAAERTLVSELALDIGETKTAVYTAKKALQDGDPMLVSSGYPLPALPPPDAGVDPRPEDALLYALMRQESQFDAEAISRAGARGLMQVRPPTARHAARKLRVRYVEAKLTGEPAYNIRLGRAYLGELLDRYNGNYPMAVAAYNAGPNRVDRWIEELGDPRTTSIDTIDWIEMLPYRETRNYVERVLENLQVYRWRLGTAKLIPTSRKQVFRAMGKSSAEVEADAAAMQPPPAAPVRDGERRIGVSEAEACGTGSPPSHPSSAC